MNEETYTVVLTKEELISTMGAINFKRNCQGPPFSDDLHNLYDVYWRALHKMEKHEHDDEIARSIQSECIAILARQRAEELRKVFADRSHIKEIDKNIRELRRKTFTITQAKDYLRWLNGV